VILIGLKHKPSKGGSKKENEETKLVSDSNILTSASTFMDGTNSIFGSTVNCTEVERKSHAENTKSKASKSKSKVKEGSEDDFMDTENGTLDILNEIQNFTD
jgi:S-methylmethionine-dependent homocysteine/selenocysteine methylase